MSETLYEYPRLSRFFRAFSDLDRPKCWKNDGNTIEQRRKWEADRVRRGLQWREVYHYMEKEVGPRSPVLKDMDRLRSLAVDLTGGDQNQDVVDDAAMFLLQLLLEEKHVLQKHMQQFKQMFGSVSSNMANKAFQCVKDIREHVSESCLEYVKSGGQSCEKKERIFGKYVKYIHPQKRLFVCDTSGLEDMTVEAASEALRQFTMKYDETIAPAQTKEEPRRNQGKKNGYGRAWLEKELKKYPSNLAVEEQSDTIVNMLTSGRSNDELQNELFDLLGFDRFELIQSLLEHRADIVRSIEEKKYVNSSQSILEQRRPNYGCQVIVQSEQEKMLIKQALKEEKKIQRIVGKLDDSDDEMNEMRLVREASVKSRAAPTLRDRMRAARPSQETYPHVYDSQRDAQKFSGFISGVKMMLPEGVHRDDNKMYEEVNIPISEPPPTHVGNKLVEISSLDKVCQMAFHGMRTLNRIQSVVFDTAYHTNENLLICAPTGAGKTNVAMLAIVSQIRQFMEHDIIKKNEFKIVYVAPMKALAAEMTQNFSRRLACLGIAVRELTGDMQLTKMEILQTQMLVTTPEKWDVVTRKGTGDIALTNLVKLLIIDEVHLLHGDRGPVVEALVARTLRQVESTQNMIRIVGLSATLPNYLDVARFLRVNPRIGLFFFDSRFRPVPLRTTFVGIKSTKPLQQMNDMDQVCFDKVMDLVQKGHQVMVFVHTRNATVRTATVLKEMALRRNQLQLLAGQDSNQLGLARKAMARSRNKQLVELFNYGFAIHHAGMLRCDRNLVEKYFSDGHIKVLVCTSTLAWGVNLPAHGVIIRGTEIYNAKHGSFVDLSILDVLQIFGRAGRPQFDTSGHGVIITTHDKLSHYLSLLTNQYPIESNFIACLADNLNAEVALGTITNIEEAVKWLRYTYLFVRMQANPQVYGINYQAQDESNLVKRCMELINSAAEALDKACMLRYNFRTGDLNITDLGRTASHFYIKYDTVEIFNTLMKPIMTDGEVLAMISQSQEFQQLKVRDDEMNELDQLTDTNCEVAVAGGSENVHGKVNILLQTFLSRGCVSSFSLMSDLAYITQNAVRIVRALFEIQLRRNNPLMAARFLELSQMFEQQQWNFQSPMRQFRILSPDIIHKMEELQLDVLKLRDMDAKDIGILLHHHKMGYLVKQCADEFPLLDMDATLQPITRTVLRIRLQVKANFRWNDKVHGKTSEAFYIWIEDPDNNFMYHSEYFIITRKQVMKREVQELVMTIPLAEPPPPQYYVKATSDRWLHSSSMHTLTFQHLILPERHPPNTDLLELQPLPVTALGKPQYEMLYPFTHFNPIQTQIFHCVYHTDNNVLLGAPTGSGKTIVAEMAIFRVFEKYPGGKIVYIAPLKALVRERILDWKVRLERKLDKKVVELTGDVTPDVNAIREANVIVTTPEKWDGISRSWQTRNYVRDVALIIIDEIHLLGEDRGPVLEVIVSRTNYIASHTLRPVRIIGLSTALANARDLAAWLKIGEMGLYNFRPSVRPVPLEVHISGFPGKHYCPRMATMNKPTFQAIRQHSPSKPALVFVSSRRQTRLTALDLIAYLAAEDDPKQWLHLPEEEMELLLASIKDTNLKLTLAFGIGLHHAGLQERDRKTVEELFVNQKIQVLVATATLAWGVNFPAHLVVIKGTEYYDGKVKRYVDMPITDVLQMMGRAGRPQYDDRGVAVILVHDVKKNFYKKFLYEPFPVESSLLEVLSDHLNAEVVAGTVQTKQDALNYLTWTYFFLRLHQNPTYYKLEGLTPEDVNMFLSNLAQRSLNVLAEAYCVQFEEDERGVRPTSMGRIASYYYLSHQTMLLLKDSLSPDLSLEKLLKLLSDVHEYSQIPVRHNEDILNGELAKSCPLPVDQYALDSSHTKTLLLLQAHFSHLHLPCADYFTDLKSVLDQAIRILQAMIDVCAEQGWLATTLRLQQILQMVIQARWIGNSPLLTLPHLEPHHMYLWKKQAAHSHTLPGLQAACANNYETLATILRRELTEGQIEQVYQVLRDLPRLRVDVALRWAGCGLEESQNEETRFMQPPPGDEWRDVWAGEEYTLVARLHRLNRSRDTRVHCPRFPKGKDEGWFLMLGCIDSAELLAMKRVQGSRATHQLTFLMPARPGHLILTVYIISDGYIGLDQQYNLQLNVSQRAVPAAASGMTDVNSLT